MAKKKLNSILIDGRLGRDAELRQASSYQIAKFSICHNNSKKVNGEWQDDPMWIDIEYFMHDSDNIANFTKGQIVEITGALKQDNWTTQDGQKQSKMKIMASEIKIVPRDDNSSNSGHSEPFKDDLIDDSTIPF